MDKSCEVVPTHYGEATSSDIGVHLNIDDHNFDSADSSGYNHHHMETMLSDVFRWDNDTSVNGHNVEVETFL